MTVIHAGTLLAEPGKAPLRNASVIVRGRTIDAVRRLRRRARREVVDLRNATVLPGLIDSHVHLSGLDDRFQARLQRVTATMRTRPTPRLINARKTLLAGFTTVRDLGGEPRLILPLRDAINAGEFAGPTIIVAPARMVSVIGGHGDPRNGAQSRRSAAVAASEQCLQRRRRLPPRRARAGQRAAPT